MGQILDEVLTKVRLRVPDVANRWSDSDIQKAIHLADLAVKEEGETSWTSQEISLTDDTMYYDLSTSAVAVSAVEFATDGSDYDYMLRPITYSELDKISHKWQTLTGSIPSHYLLLSAPGTEGYGKIMIWRPIASVSSETIRVWYAQCIPTFGVSMAAATAPAWVQDAVYVPYTLSVLTAKYDPRRAAGFMNAYDEGIAQIRKRYRKEYYEYSEDYAV